ncbi:uncharacterized protein LOC135480482 [Liolophura sinensis]|uniref:uncharacterized protein LOC135480482 n=1 Tax=Liolophura sinensis TaxID=3198878 RepID=UPI003159610B
MTTLPESTDIPKVASSYDPNQPTTSQRSVRKFANSHKPAFLTPHFSKQTPKQKVATQKYPPDAATLKPALFESSQPDKNAASHKPAHVPSPPLSTKSSVKVTSAKTSVPILLSSPVPIPSSVPTDMDKNQTLNNPDKEADEGNGGVIAGVIISLLLVVAIVVTVVVTLRVRGKKPTLAKLVWYHKGTPGHKKIEDQEELVPGAGIQNPVYEEEQDINFNIPKGPILRYPSDTSIDSAFISNRNSKSAYDEFSGSTCQLLPHDSV